MKKVFMSGCYDVLHAGHIRIFEAAHKYGDHLIVCFASDAVLLMAKKRKSSISEASKRMILESLQIVDEVVMSSDLDPIFDFKGHFERLKPDILLVTDDDERLEEKRRFAETRGAELVAIPREFSEDGSTTAILASIKEVTMVPLRVDFAGGWLDVPKFARPDGYIVNCTISPLVSLENWPYHQNAGLGGSAAYALLQAKNGVRSELDQGVGWQDPAIIAETGLCVWRSGERPVLDLKTNPDWLQGKMMIVWTGKTRMANNQTLRSRDYDRLVQAGAMAREGTHRRDTAQLAKAVTLNYEVQKDEGMEALPEIQGSLAKKYLGAGHGGYALYLFDRPEHRAAALSVVKEASPVEPYIKHVQMA
jgi:cytidyltransferase-like protein